jgi:hypothetical protein
MGRTWTAISAVATLLIGAAALAALAELGGGVAYAAAAVSAPTITRSAHVSFGTCNAQQITLSVTVPSHAFKPGQPVTYTVQLRNTGSTTCGAQLAKGVPQARHQLTVGPCGPLPLEVRNARGVNVYPGPAVFHCPEETGFELGPHSQARATGSWSQAAYLGSPSHQQPEQPQQPLQPRQASPGSYRLTVDQAVTVPLTLTRASG